MSELERAQEQLLLAAARHLENVLQGCGTEPASAFLMNLLRYLSVEEGQTDG